MGQAIGLPVAMALLSFVGIAATGASIALYGEVIQDPVALLVRASGAKGVGAVLALIGLLLATLSTNIAANVVSPAYALSSAWPKRLSFATGGLVAAVLGMVCMPWKLVADTQVCVCACVCLAGCLDGGGWVPWWVPGWVGRCPHVSVSDSPTHPPTPKGFIFTWLIGYSALLGPVAGILIADYFVIRRRTLNVDALYSADPKDEYYYSNGVNRAAIGAVVVGAAPSVPGFLVAAKFYSASAFPAWLGAWRNDVTATFATAIDVATSVNRHQRTGPSTPSPPPTDPHAVSLSVGLYDHAWLLGFVISTCIYLAVAKRPRETPQDLAAKMA